MLSDGSHLGMNLSCTAQKGAGGFAEAFRIGAGHIGNGPSALSLGDNLLPDLGLWHVLQRTADSVQGYADIEFLRQGRATRITDCSGTPHCARSPRTMRRSTYACCPVQEGLL